MIICAEQHEQVLRAAMYPADLAGLREADGGQHHAGRLEGHVDGVWLPHARQDLCDTGATIRGWVGDGAAHVWARLEVQRSDTVWLETVDVGLGGALRSGSEAPARLGI